MLRSHYIEAAPVGCPPPSGQTYFRKKEFIFKNVQNDDRSIGDGFVRNMLINSGGLTGSHDQRNIHQLNLQPYRHHPRHLKQSNQLHLLHGSGGVAERRPPHCPDPSHRGGLSPKALLLNGLSSLLSSVSMLRLASHHPNPIQHLLSFRDHKTHADGPSSIMSTLNKRSSGPLHPRPLLQKPLPCTDSKRNFGSSLSPAPSRFAFPQSHHHMHWRRSGLQVSCHKF